MARIFKRGELKNAVLIVAAALEEAHGYAIMSDLESRIGGWKASPGAIYPALVALVDADYLRVDDDGDRKVYVITPTGRAAAERAAETIRWSSLAGRLDGADSVLTVGTVLDRFAETSPSRRRLIGTDEQQAIESILTRAQDAIADTLTPKT